MTNIWRLNIKTGAKKHVDPRRFCLERNILGIGWQIDSSSDDEVSWEHYYQEARGRYSGKGRSWKVAINAVKKRMKVGDLCWTRDRDGTYYLGIILSEWRYATSLKHKDADVVNVRDCHWLRVGTVDLVPGKVVNSYISGSTVQAVKGRSIKQYSTYLANQLLAENRYPIEPDTSDLLSLISADDCEDLVGIYLQSKGYFMIPSSCKSDTAVYEYVMRHKDTGEKAVAQVKQGTVDLNADHYRTLECQVYLFTTKGRYVGEPHLNIHCLEPSEMSAFALENYGLMSERIQRWIDFYRSVAVKAGGIEEQQREEYGNTPGIQY